jgi:hypothetical protein
MKSHCVFIKVIIYIFPVLFIPEWGIGQNGFENKHKTNDQLWIDIYPHFYVSEKFEYYGDVGYRTLLNQNIWHWLYVRPSVRYHMGKKWEVHGGIGFFYVFKKEVSDRFEIRLWQGIQVSWPRIRKLGFNHYVRFEQRISFQTNGWSSSFSLRLRYKISGRWDFLNISKERFWFIPFYGELFYPVGDEVKEAFRNRGRLGFGLGYNPSDVWRFSLNITWQSSRTGLNEDFTVSDIIYQIKIRKYLNVDRVKSLFDD